VLARQHACTPKHGDRNTSIAQRFRRDVASLSELAQDGNERLLEIVVMGELQCLQSSASVVETLQEHDPLHVLISLIRDEQRGEFLIELLDTHARGLVTRTITRGFGSFAKRCTHSRSGSPDGFALDQSGSRPHVCSPMCTSIGRR